MPVISMYSNWLNKCYCQTETCIGRLHALFKISTISVVLYGYCASTPCETKHLSSIPQIQFWRTQEGPDSLREVDYIQNIVKQYPRPRMKRQANYNYENEYDEDLEEEEDEEDQMEIYTLENLPAFSEIAVQIRVLNKYYVGPPSEVVYFKTQESRKSAL